MNSRMRKKINQVFWKKDIPISYIYIREMQEKEKFFLQKGTLAQTKTKMVEWIKNNTYKIDQNGYWKHLYVNEKGKLKHYVCHTLDDSKNKQRLESGEGKILNQGTIAIKVENQLFKEINGVTPRVAFGYCDRPLIHKCVPKQLYYINPDLKNRNLKHVSKADFSSHFPASMCGKLPTWKGHLRLSGTVEPTKEYPFAFYIKSGHLAEYGAFDSHKWLNHKMNFSLFGENITIIPKEDDETILCKASEYEYTEVEKKLYEYKLKKEKINGVDAKIVLNSAIGYKHLKNLNSKVCRLDHIAAVTIARANQKMVNLYDELGSEVLMIVVDGIIYKSTREIGTHVKGLGNLMQEITDCDFRMRGINQYLFMKDGIVPEDGLCHGSFNDNIVATRLEDINLWRKTI